MIWCLASNGTHSWITDLDSMYQNIHAGLNICEISEMPAVNASFWYKYNDLIKQDAEKLKSINDWKCNPMAALPAWLPIVSQK